MWCRFEKKRRRMSCMHDNLIREREGGRLPLEVRLGSQVDIVTQMTKWTRNINLTLNIGLRVSGLSFGFSGSPCFIKKPQANQVIKHTQECEAGLVYRTYCIDTSTFCALNLLKFLPTCHQKWTPRTQKSPPTAPSPSPPIFFLDSLSSEAPGHQRL